MKIHAYIAVDPVEGKAYANAVGSDEAEAGVAFDMIEVPDDVRTRVEFKWATITFDPPEEAE